MKIIRRFKRAWQAFMAPEPVTVQVINRVMDSVELSIRTGGGPLPEALTRLRWGGESGPEVMTTPKDKP